MILKSLELVGFKSFVDATHIDFTKGFTVVVGPNGCGKSNVSDAIRWVIGEQSSKTLRGTRTSDLIFNGSESRKPVNRTEISLTLADVPPGLKIANVPNLGEEVKVTRCYHRSGESECYINQVPCRLKDITDLFLDLGISPKVLTVIEQNHIQHLIASKPEDRRILIEEAAGILKFKQRKQEALRKLEASSQNLARITDLVQELGRQTESLKRQAAKAERYKTFQSEYKELSLNLFSQKIRKFSVQLEEINAECERLAEEKTNVSARAAEIDNRLTQLKIKIEEMTTELNAKRERVHALGSEISKDEHAVELKKQQIEQAETDTAKADDEIAQMKIEIESILLEGKQQREELGNISGEINSREEVCQEKSRALEQNQESLRQRNEEVRTHEGRVMAMYQNLAQRKNDLATQDARLEFLDTRESKLKNEMQDTRGQRDETSRQLASVAEAHSGQTSQLEALRAEQGQARERLESARAELKSRSEYLSQAKETQVNATSMLNSLKELRRRFEGFQEGVKSLMAGEGNGSAPVQGLREVLVDVLKAPEEYERAVGAVLGDKLQSVIVNSYSDTLEAVDYLKTRQSGRGSFIPMHPKTLPPLPLNLNGDQGVLGKVMGFIECNEEYRAILQHLLGNVVLVDTLETALELHSHDDFCGTVVTRNGEVIDPQGIVTGGESQEDHSRLLAQNREIEDLTRQVDSAKQELATAEENFNEATALVSACEERLRQADSQVHQAEIELASGKKDLEQLQRDLERLDQKCAAIDHERASSEQERAELSGQKESLLRDIAELETEKQKEEESLESLRNELQQAREQIQVASDEIGSIKVMIAALKGKRENIFSELKRFDVQCENLSQRIDKRAGDQKDNAGRIDNYRIEIEQLEQKILEKVREKDRLAEESTTEDENLREQETILRELEKESKELFVKVQETSETLSASELKRSEIKIERAHVQERAYEDFAVTVEEMLNQYEGNIDAAETEETLRTLKDKIARMGEVNLAAVSDFEETNERYTFLKRQEDDLAESIAALHQAIKKIDCTTRTRFEETFEVVSENFKRCFARLFQGGKAELILMDPAHPLESGIDIIAQPRGKKNQSISLLSQGEKAMTAVAMMFAIFSVRPSPFCLLDEVDAPLDEANILRFHDLLLEMSDKTQFILITHNQKTMSFADVLYGVTMEERGVSKVVSVHLNN